MNRATLRIVLALVLFAPSIALAPTPARAQEPRSGVAADVQGNQGIQDGWALDDQGNVLFTAADANLMAQTGAGWVRIHFRLGAFKDWTETGNFGYSALSRYD